MAEISKINIGGQDYNIKDTVARAGVAGGVTFRGITTTAITDKSAVNNTTGITIGSNTIKDIKSGDLVIYESKEFIAAATGTSGALQWNELGSTGSLGTLAYKNSGTVSAVGTHTHKYDKTTSITVGQGSVSASGTFTPSGTNADSAVTFASHTTDGVLGEATTFTNGSSSVTFNTTNNTASAITSLPSSTVPAYSLGNATTKHITATASGTALNTGTVSITGYTATRVDPVADSGSLCTAKVDGEVLTLTACTVTQRSAPTLGGTTTFATSVKTNPTITLADTATSGGVVVVTGQGTLSTSGTNSVSFGTPGKATVLKSSVTATAAAQTITVGTNDKVTAITALGTATAAGQKFTGTANQTVSVSGSTSGITATPVHTSTDTSQVSASSKSVTFA